MTCRSEWQAPAPPIRITTCPGPASGSGTSTSSGSDCHLVWRSARTYCLLGVDVGPPGGGSADAGGLAGAAHGVAVVRGARFLVAGLGTAATALAPRRRLGPLPPDGEGDRDDQRDTVEHVVEPLDPGDELQSLDAGRQHVDRD